MSILSNRFLWVCQQLLLQSKFNADWQSVLMAKINVNIRMDEDLKRQFKDSCAVMGMSMTTAITILRVRQ